MNSSHSSLDVSWQQPTFLLPLFGLAVLLASTESLALGISVAAIITLTALLASLLMLASIFLQSRPLSGAHWLLCSSTLIATIEMLIHAWGYEIYRKLGLFLPMVILIPLLLGRKELQHDHHSVSSSLIRALRMSGGYALAAIVLGAGREFVGHGSLFFEAGQLWGSWATPLEVHFFQPEMGFTLASLVPGALVGLGLGIALYNWLQLKGYFHRKATQP